jgi:branched-chain amino acid transport system permease protein
VPAYLSLLTLGYSLVTWSRILAVSLVGLLSLMPLVLNPYWVFVLGYGLTLAIACLGVNLLLGHTVLSLGHAAYFGIGAYTGAFLFTFGDAYSLEVYLAALRTLAVP